ncbi:MAG: PIN domain-containing protein [Acidimicrobiales bacterium]
MTPVQRGLVFVDTNVLVYAHDAAETTRQPIAEALLDALWRTRSGTLSTQVLQEFYVVATRTFDPPMSRRDARDVVDAYGQWHLVHVDLPLILAASQLEERHRLSFWDALIVEAARRAGARQLLSEDLQSGQRLAGVLIDNPFAAAM